MTALKQRQVLLQKRRLVEILVHLPSFPPPQLSPSLSESQSNRHYEATLIEMFSASEINGTMHASCSSCGTIVEYLIYP